MVTKSWWSVGAGGLGSPALLYLAAAGVEIYRGDRLPKDMIGDLFFNEPVGRIVRRAKVVVTDGMTPAMRSSGVTATGEPLTLRQPHRCGLGIGYISPVSTLIKWFPDRRGMATGMAIMGFGGGAMIGAPLADKLMGFFATPTSPGWSAWTSTAAAASRWPT